MTEKWEFSLDKASDAVWTDGLREIFEYRDLGIKDATKGDYVAHIVKANGKEMADEVQHWHVHSVGIVCEEVIYSVQQFNLKRCILVKCVH